MMRPNGVETQVRPVIPDYLCFTANAANSTVKLTKNGNPTGVSLETSVDRVNWSSYTMWNAITLSYYWDKIYFRSSSSIPTWFSTDTSNYYKFVMTWSIAASWDVNFLLCKTWTATLSNYCYFYLFYDCTVLTASPSLNATTLWEHCYRWMFYNCSNLVTIPRLPALNVPTQAYNIMFTSCSKIKLSTTETGDYTQPYRMPTDWTWTAGTNAFLNMFMYTWGTFKTTASINTTYYVHKDNVII